VGLNMLMCRVTHSLTRSL